MGEAVRWNHVPRWMLPRAELVLLPRRSVMEPCALLDAAQSRTGSAAQTICTVLLLLLTVHLLPLRRSLSRWLPRSSVMEPCALLDAALKSTGSAVLIICTVLLLKLIAQWLPNI